MKIGIVSDTHMPARAKALPQALISGLKGVDFILHAGDWVSPDVAAMLERIAPLDGVAGNNDGEDIRRKFGRKKILSFGRYRIGLVHGDGSRKSTEQRALEAFQHEKVDVVIFGHSHVPYKRSHNGILLYNPGSATDKRRQEQYSYGIMELADEVRVQTFYYDSKL
ncbi:phosphodiesterase [Paenibacillus swuensis]|uniref:Phosphoesterase n=1 Tax=Paenibacillus swuensis TaxID=1178515 RepID=A0A172TL79_9BACL|nr:metallophosphoesterase [Paenibacillus swuensis]ANE47791.1 phosphodiesterase [Paenibacillus swuensis]